MSEKLKEYVQEAELTQSALAEKTGILNACLSNYMAGKSTPTYKNLTKLLYEFDCSANELLGQTDLQPREKLYPVLPFGERLRAALNEFGVSQEKLKRELPVSGSVVYKWLSGKSEPLADTLVRIATYLDCSVDYLIGRRR